MKAKLKTLKRGQTFYGAGIQWLVLGHTNSSQGLPIVTHIVSTGIVERRAFDEKNRNDLGVSTLLAYLNGEFLERLEDAFGEGAVAEQFIDLTSNDGLKDYGNVKAKVGLLTEEEYRQHRDILPPLGDEGWWWLATPYSTERAGYPSLVRYVYSDGTLHHYAYNGDYGVRPALYLKSDISVSLDGNDESTIEVSEEELYKAAVQKFGERAQILVAIEEMSELTKALLKYIRHEDFNQGDYDDIVESIAEERADVSIMLNQLAVIFGKNEDAKTRRRRSSNTLRTSSRTPYEQADFEEAGKAVHGQLHPREDTRSLYLQGGTPPVRQRLCPAVRRAGGALPGNSEGGPA